MMSVSQLVLAGLWLCEGIVTKDLRGRFARLFRTPVAWMFTSIWLVHVLGLMWTDEMKWGLDLCRILLPILVLGVVVGTTNALSKSEWRTILLLSSASTLVSTVVCYALTAGDDFRELSMFISHIRLALLVCMSVVILLRFWPKSILERSLHIVGALWALWFLMELGSWMGVIILLVIGSYILVRSAIRTARRSASIIMLSSAMLVLVSAASYLHFYIKDHHAQIEKAKQLPLVEKSAGGEIYYHDLEYEQIENGNLVWTYIADVELQHTWERRSELPYLSSDLQGHNLRATLLRYMSSRNLTKDSVGMAAMGDADVRRVEQGVTNVAHGARNPLIERLEQSMFEMDHYRHSGDANGHTLAMRLEFWKAGHNIIQDNWLIGVGTGDAQKAFDEQYDRVESKLRPEWRLRAHNQFLTWAISFGVLGPLLLLSLILVPAWMSGAYREPLFVAFLITLLISFLTEDTLETQAGATFFAFYYAVLVFARPNATEPPTAP